MRVIRDYLTCGSLCDQWRLIAPGPIAVFERLTGITLCELVSCSHGESQANRTAAHFVLIVGRAIRLSDNLLDLHGLYAGTVCTTSMAGQ